MAENDIGAMLNGQMSLDIAKLAGLDVNKVNGYNDAVEYNDKGIAIKVEGSIGIVKDGDIAVPVNIDELEEIMKDADRDGDGKLGKGDMQALADKHDKDLPEILKNGDFEIDIDKGIQALRDKDAKGNKDGHISDKDDILAGVGAVQEVDSVSSTVANHATRGVDSPNLA